jgi:beta-1,4-N-acetylglucosaminyltransferase
VVVLGSGGHTAEMMSLLRNVNPTRYIQRSYIVSSGDNFSTGKALEIERIIQTKYKPGGTVTHPGDMDSTGIWDIKVVPRARKVHQPLYSAPFSSLWSLIGCLGALREASRTSRAAPLQYPDLIITNGPATAVMVILASMILKFLGLAPVWTMKTIYVESWARVQTLSLTGKILLRSGLCDKFIVQWEGLANKINGNDARKKVEWKGFLVD